MLRKYEMPWRRAYESIPAMVWIAACGFFMYSAVRADTPVVIGLPLALICLVMSIHRWRQAIRILVLRASLSGRAMQVITSNRLRKLCRDQKEVFLGFGFAWLPVHSQRLYDLEKIDYREYAICRGSSTSWVTK